MTARISTQSSSYSAFYILHVSWWADQSRQEITGRSQSRLTSPCGLDQFDGRGFQNDGQIWSMTEPDLTEFDGMSDPSCRISLASTEFIRNPFIFFSPVHARTWRRWRFASIHMKQQRMTQGQFCFSRRGRSWLIWKIKVWGGKRSCAFVVGKGYLIFRQDLLSKLCNRSAISIEQTLGVFSLMIYPLQL